MLVPCLTIPRVIELAIGSFNKPVEDISMFPPPLQRPAISFVAISITWIIGN
jgi:hypothetical protein